MSCRPIFSLGIASLSVFSLFNLCPPAEAKCPPPPRPAIAIEAGRPLPNDPLKPAVVVLGEYLDLIKKPKKETSIRLDVAPEGGKSYRAIAVLGEQRFEAPFSFPETLNDALVSLTERLSKSVGKPLAAKKILPFLNQTDSEAALIQYADGVLALERADWTAAAAAFEGAVGSDYNYVEAYAGLGLAHAALGHRPQAKAALQKAKLLNPYRAKKYEDLANRYLENDCGGNG